MVEEILPDLYRIEVPLPRSPLKALNSYIVKAPGRFLIIDTAWNREECELETLSGLKTLSVDLKKTDFFITHLHADHTGLVAKLATDTSKIYFNGIEASILNSEVSDNRQKETTAFYKSHGFPEKALEKSLAVHPGHRYGLREYTDFCILKVQGILRGTCVFTSPRKSSLFAETTFSLILLLILLAGLSLIIHSRCI